MSASINNRNNREQLMLAALVFAVRTPEPVYVRPLRAPLRQEPAMTMRQALKVYGEASK
jgi:hypothetical protein